MLSRRLATSVSSAVEEIYSVVVPSHLRILYVLQVHIAYFLNQPFEVEIVTLIL